MTPALVFFVLVAFIVLVAIAKTAVVVPQKTAFIVERLGKYRCTLEAGFHILVPFFDRIAYRHSLKEQAIDVPPQECITKDSIAAGAVAKRAELARARVSARGPDSSARSLPTDN